MDVRTRSHGSRRRRWFPRALSASVLALAMLTTAVVPALAAETTTTGAQSCDALDPAVTTTLAEVRQQIGADTQGLTGAGIGVAVIDTGVNRVTGLAQAGKVVDGPDLSFDGTDDTLRYRDLHGHGTNMAAIIAGQGGSFGDGVAPSAHIVNVKVGAADGQADVSQVIAAIDWVIQNRDLNGNNIRVLNLSFNTDATQSYLIDPLSRAVQNAWKAGIVVVAAGGNDGLGVQRLGNPATNPYVIAVGAAQADDATAAWTVPAWSSRGDGIRNPDVVAPGVAVLSAGVPGSYLAANFPTAVCDDPAGGQNLRGSGTSQAAAVTAGAAALLLEQRPGLTPDQVKYLLTSTADFIGLSLEAQGNGVVDLAGALAAPTPGIVATQLHALSDGLGSLEAARGNAHVERDGDRLEGELTAFGRAWNPSDWRKASGNKAAWVDQSTQRGRVFWDRGAGNDGALWDGATWLGGTWSDVVRDAIATGATWSGATWSGATWSGATWSGATWSGATWSGATWSGATWSGATWSGATWSGATWSGATWS